MKQKPTNSFNKIICQDKIIFFEELANRLLVSYLIVVVLKYIDIPFPPNAEDCEMIFENLFTNAENDNLESIPDRMVVRQEYSNYADNILHGDYEEYTEIDVTTSDTFLEMLQKCLIIRDWYRFLSLIGNDNFFRRAEQYGIITACKAYELIGYWTMKMEGKRRNIEKAGRKKRQDKLEKIETIKELLLKYNLSDKRQKIEFMAEALKKTGVTNSRSIENYLKKIKEKS
jgi:hypothetical protein